MSFTKRGLTFAFFMLFGLMSFSACAQRVDTQDVAQVSSEKNSNGYTDITVSQLAEMLNDNQEALLINVHIPYAGNIPQTDMSIPFNQIDANLDQLPTDKDAPLIIYCRSGSMSTQAAETLVRLGFTNVFEVDGGMNAWQNSGRELEIN